MAGLLRYTPRLYRLGTYVNVAAVGQEALVPPPTSVGCVDLAREPGFSSSRPAEKQEDAKRIERFEEHCRGVIAGVASKRTASLESMLTLLSHGDVEKGMSMFEFLKKQRALHVHDYPGIITALAFPQMWNFVYEKQHCAMEAYKQLGECRGKERASEAQHVYDCLIKELPHNIGEGAQRDDKLYSIVITAWNELLNVYCTGGYTECLKVPDRLYDDMAMQQLRLQPTLKTYLAVIRALGLANRMEECEAVWSWLVDRSSTRLHVSAYNTMMECFLEAERFHDVESLFASLVGASVIPNAHTFDIVANNIWRHSNSGRGTILAVELKKLVFLPTWMRKHGVHHVDLALCNQKRIQDAVERWTFEKGLAKTTEWMLDKRTYEYEAWNEGQRWKHLEEDDINTSMIESGVRRMRGDEIKERMRLDVQTGGGRGVIYPPTAYEAVTRYSSLQEKKVLNLWEKEGLHGLIGHDTAPSRDKVMTNVVDTWRHRAGRKEGPWGKRKV